MSAAGVMQRLGDGVATVAFGFADVFAVAICALAMAIIFVVSQVVRVNQERLERRSFRRGLRAGSVRHPEALVSKS